MLSLFIPRVKLKNIRTTLNLGFSYCFTQPFHQTIKIKSLFTLLIVLVFTDIQILTQLFVELMGEAPDSDSLQKFWGLKSQLSDRYNYFDTL